jgi:hypothetical protein
VYSSNNNGPRTLSWFTPAITELSSVYLDSNLTRKFLLCR